MRTDVLRQDVDFQAKIIIDWAHRLAAWRGLISLTILLIASFTLWAAVLWPILSLFR